MSLARCENFNLLPGLVHASREGLTFPPNISEINASQISPQVVRESASFGKKDVAQVIQSKHMAIYNDILLFLWYEANS